MIDTANSRASTTTRSRYADVPTARVDNLPTRVLFPPLNILLFRPKVILVEQHGCLVGLVTVKDVLRYTALEHHEGLSSWEDHGSFTSMTEEAWTWIRQFTHNLLHRIRSH